MVSKLIDTFKQTADQIAFLDRGYGVGKPDVQSAIEKVYQEINRKSPTLDIVSVKDFGAVGDGVTDDRTAIQNAINASPNRIVYLPPGEYYVNTPLELNRPVILEGAGMGQTIIRGRNGQNIINAYSSVFLRNLTLTSTEWGIGVRMNAEEDVSHFILDRVEISHCERAVFWPTNGAGVDMIYINNCHIHNISIEATFFGPPRLKAAFVTGCYIHDVYRSGIRFGSNDAENQETRTHILIHGNRIHNVMPYQGSSEVKGIHIASAKYATITNNHVSNIEDSSGDSEGIYTKVLYVNVSHNTLIDAGTGPNGFISIKGGDESPEGRNAIINGNHLIATDPTYGMAITVQADRLIMTSNMIEGFRKAGSQIVRIDKSGNERLLIANNQIVAGAPNTIQGIRITGTNRNTIIANNQFVGLYQYAIRFVQSTENVIITGNTFRDMTGYGGAIGFDTNSDKTHRGIIITSNGIFNDLTSSEPTRAVNLTYPSEANIEGWIVSQNIFSVKPEREPLNFSDDPDRKIVVKDNIEL